jgi:hypothetical protein
MDLMKKLKTWKMRISLSRTWNMAKKKKKKTEKLGKLEMHTVGLGIW